LGGLCLMLVYRYMQEQQYAEEDDIVEF